MEERIPPDLEARQIVPHESYVVAPRKDALVRRALADIETLDNRGAVYARMYDLFAAAVSGDHSEEVRSNAAEALRQMAEEGEEEALDTFVIPWLIELLEDEDYSSQKAAMALGGIGPAAKAAVPALIIALQDGDDTLRGTAAWALGKIDPEDKRVVPALIEALRDWNIHVCLDAIEALGDIGPPARLAIPVLERFLLYTLPHRGFRDAVLLAIARIQGPN